MNKLKHLYLFIILLSAETINAQHCPFDNVGLVVLDIADSSNQSLQYQPILYYKVNSKGMRVGKSLPLDPQKIYDLHKNFGDNWFEFKGTHTPTPYQAFNQLIELRIEDFWK